MAVSAAAMALILAVSVIALRRDAGAPAPMGAGDQAKDAKIGVNLLSNPENNSDIKQYEQRIDHLKQSIEQRMVAWNPELRMTYERNMLYVDQSLAECRHELNNNPGDQDSEALMLNAYREKVRLLEGFSKF